MYQWRTNPFIRLSVYHLDSPVLRGEYCVLLIARECYWLKCMYESSFISLQVMRCISQLELAQLISTGVNPQVLLNTGGMAGKGGGAGKRGGAVRQKDLDTSMPRLTTQVSMNSVLGSGGEQVQECIFMLFCKIT